MRKNLLKTLVVGSLLSMSTTAFAANPFELVPTSNWAYDAIDTLVQADIYEGYRDLNFSKKQTFTRYELATFVGKALANQDKANTEQKATIDKLAAEFKVELSNLGVYTSATTPVAPATGTAAALADKVKISGDTRFRYEYTKSNKYSDDVNFRTRFNVDVDMGDGWNFRTRFVNSNNITAYDGKDDSGSSNTKIDLSFVKGTVGEVGVAFGRLPLTLGKGMLVDTDKNWNGAKFDFGDKIKAQVGYARAGDLKKAKYFFADASTNLTKDLDITASYLKDSSTKIDAAEYKAWTAGFGYNGFKNLAVVGEYGRNNVKSAKAWMTGLTFRQADRKKVGSWSASTIYRKAAPGFDPQYWSTVDASYAVENSAMNDIQGIEYAVDYVPMKGAILHLSYGDMKNYAGNDSNDRQYFISNLSYKF